MDVRTNLILSCPKRSPEYALGDGEEEEGNVAEAARHASHLKLRNLVCIIDRNRKQLSRPLSETDSNSNLHQLWSGYGWRVLEIENGHDIQEILSAYSQIGHADAPTLIIANTIKGKDLPGAEAHFCGYHTIGSCPRDVLTSTIEEREAILSQMGDIDHELAQWIKELDPCVRPHGIEQVEHQHITVSISEENESGNTRLNVAQRYYFQELGKIFSQQQALQFYTLTADFIPLNVIELCGFNKLGHVIDVGLREQHLIAMAYGISVTDPNTRFFINYGDAFFYRAADQIHAAAQGHGKFLVALESSGVSMAENGATHQSSGQPGALLNMPGVILLEPTDAQDLFNCLNWAYTANPGLVCVRIHGVPVAPLPVAPENRSIEYYVVREVDAVPDLVIVASGFVTRSSLDAAEILKQQYDLQVRVINVVNMNSLNEGFVSLLEDGVPILTVYNGNPKVLQLAVAGAAMQYPMKRPSTVIGHGFESGTTGSVSDLIHYLKLDAIGIADRVVNLSGERAVS